MYFLLLINLTALLLQKKKYFFAYQAYIELIKYSVLLEIRHPKLYKSIAETI